jgi:uncharacterized protein YbaR (Trm112 family)
MVIPDFDKSSARDLCSGNLHFEEFIMVSKDLLDILRCPACVREKEGLLDYYQEAWLVCRDCGRKYPIRHDIPVMLIDEGDKWVNTAVEALPVPPPEE